MCTLGAPHPVSDAVCPRRLVPFLESLAHMQLRNGYTLSWVVWLSRLRSALFSYTKKATCNLPPNGPRAQPPLPFRSSALSALPSHFPTPGDLNKQTWLPSLSPELTSPAVC